MFELSKGAIKKISIKIDINERWAIKAIQPENMYLKNIIKIIYKDLLQLSFEELEYQ